MLHQNPYFFKFMYFYYFFLKFVKKKAYIYINFNITVYKPNIPSVYIIIFAALNEFL
jgi:hypothetical protein